MKLIVLISLLTAMQLFAEGNAQTINLTAKHVTLNQVMRDLQKQSGVNFFLNGKSLAQTRLSVNIQHAKLEDALNAIVAPLDLEWIKKDEVIVIKPKRNPLIPEHKEVLQRGIAGKVVNGKGQALVGTTVTVKGTNISTVTDQDGKFTIQLPTTNATLVVSNVGYQGLEKSVTGNEELSIVLQELVSVLHEVDVVVDGRLMLADADARLQFVPISPALLRGEFALIAAGRERGARVVVSAQSPAMAGMLLDVTEDTTLTARLQDAGQVE